MKKFVVIGFVVLMVALLAVSTAQASPKQDFYLEASCPPSNQNACNIVSASDPFAHLVGGQILYLNRVYKANPAGHLTRIARVEVITGNEDGMAIGQVRFLTDRGRFTFGQGTGSLAGLHATGKIAITGFYPDGTVTFSLTGSYHVDP